MGNNLFTAIATSLGSKTLLPGLKPKGLDQLKEASQPVISGRAVDSTDIVDFSASSFLPPTKASTKTAKIFSPKPKAASGSVNIPKGYHVTNQTFSGNASWYGPGFHGKRTASGETFDQNSLTAANKKYPFGTLLLVTDPITKASVVVKVNDDGPHSGDRVVDLSAGAAAKLPGFIDAGHRNLQFTVLAKDDPRSGQNLAMDTYAP